MRRLLPNSTEIVIFVGLAVVCAAFVGTMDAQVHDLGLAMMAFPIFVFSAVLGLRRNWARQVALQPVPVSGTQVPATTGVEAEA